MKKLIVFVIVLLSLSSCNKDENVNADFIKKWKLERVSGGLHGQGYDVKFKYLNIINDTDCQWIDSLDNILVKGTYDLSTEDNKDFIKFVPESDSLIYTFQSSKLEYKFLSSDSLYMDQGCCDRFDYLFIKT